MTARSPQEAAAERLRHLPANLTFYDGFAEAVAALSRGQPASFDGVYGSSCALAVAALARHAPGPVVVVLPTMREADELAADLEVFAARPELFPLWETGPESECLYDETLGQRLRLVKTLLRSARHPSPASRAARDAQAPATPGPTQRGLGRYVRSRQSRRAATEQTPNADGPPAQGDKPASKEATSGGGPALEASRGPWAGQTIVTSIAALCQPVPDPSRIASATRVIRRGDRLDLDDLLRWLVHHGFHATTAVELPGEFSHRGGIVDLFAADWTLPVRIELFDDEVESIRTFEVATQRSQQTLDEVEITVLGQRVVHDAERRRPAARADDPAWWDETAEPTDPPSPDVSGFLKGPQAPPDTILGDNRDTGQFLDYLPPGSWIVLVDLPRLNEEGRNYLQRAIDPARHHSVTSVLAACSRFAVASVADVAAGTSGVACHLPIESVERFSGEIGRLRQELETVAHADEVWLLCPTPADADRLREVLAESPLMAAGRLHFPPGAVHAGFRLRPPQRGEEGTGRADDNGEARGHHGHLVLSTTELFHRAELRRLPRRHLGRAIDSFLELREGDLVVHLAHGIGRYRGLRLLDKQGHREEHLEIEFDGGTRVYVPAVRIDLVQKYVGGSKSRPALAKVGGRTWLRQKAAAERAALDLAAEMLEMQAIRMASPGIAFQPDSQWQREFDASFPYPETPDQLAAIAAIKEDMLRPRPMDRLLCGDVGFGKTEVAMRAAFKAVDSGYQVAVLVPTTILAEQHYRSFCERMAEFPIDIAKLSRFCAPQEERDTLEGLRSGRIDIVIGTHRLVSKDVQFRNLGLVIIDEEQRFGVEVKERLKSLRATVDVLTLSATPIPRTLHMSLVGLRDISNLESPPEDRLAVETKVSRWDDQLIRHAIQRELARGGQIYFVHNRVSDIEEVARRLRQIVPDVRLRVGHAQMPDEELERVMVDFVAHRFDLLVATTIVESGLDIPNANTIFIHEADRYGLADLHQLRGRVGRYKHRAYCYLLIEPHKHLTPNAARRLHAIEEFDELGAGFAIAMRDLEIRGAGNLLGTQQSGHIAAVGYELYCQLLENAVRTLQQQPPKVRFEVDIQLPGETLLPDDYVPDLRLKVDLYRRLTRVETPQQIDDLEAELLDRFGPLPSAVQRLLELARLRLDAANWRISAIYLEGEFVVLHYTDRSRIEPLVARHRGKLRLVDERSLYLPLPRGADATRIWQIVKSVLRSDEGTTTIQPRALPARGSGEVVVTGNTP